jgi:H+/Cl- antiporter ClcA
LGGATGYLIGYLATVLGGNFQIDHLPTIFAMVGSASMIASVTHTLSSAILVLEISGNYDILFPSMIGTVVAIVVSSILTDDLFTGIIDCS